MKKRSLFRRGCLLRALVLTIILLLAVVYLGLPTVMALAVIAPHTDSAGSPPEGFTEVNLTTADAISLAAWVAPPQNGTAIILVHGAGGGRESVRAYATMLQANGFGVLALNLRGYGDSGGRINRLGWNGTRDIGAAVAYLTEQTDVETIGGLGISLGGEVLLGAASTYPEIQAIAADGATYRAVNEYTALPDNRPLYRYFTQGVFSFMVGLFTRDTPPEPPLWESLQAAKTTDFLFIAAGNNDTEVAYNTFFQQTVSDPSSLWIIPNVNHTGGFSHDPAAYEQRVVDFFNALTGEDVPH